MKKIFKFAILVVCAIGLSFALMSCNKDETPSQSNTPQYEIYLLAADSGYSGTYEEWLASIKGVDGITPHIGANGNWFIGSQDTQIKASGTNGTNGTNGADGVTPHIGDNGNWFIGTQDTQIKASGANGTNGKAVELQIVDGVISWRYEGTTAWTSLINLDQLAGTNGVTPHIGANGNWFIGDSDTGVYAGTPASEIKKYTVTLDVNGGSLPLDTVTSFTNVVYGSVLQLPIPTKEGSIFRGWYTGGTANDGQFFNFSPVCCNLNLVAKWESVYYTISVPQSYVGEVQLPYGSEIVDVERELSDFITRIFVDGRETALDTLVTSDLEISYEGEDKLDVFHAKQDISNRIVNLENIYPYEYPALRDISDSYSLIGQNVRKMTRKEMENQFSILEEKIAAIEGLDAVKAFYLSEVEKKISIYRNQVNDENLVILNNVVQENIDQIQAAVSVEDIRSVYQNIDIVIAQSSVAFDKDKTIVEKYKLLISGDFTAPITELYGSNIKEPYNLFISKINLATTSQQCEAALIEFYDSLIDIPVAKGFDKEACKAEITESLAILNEGKDIFIPAAELSALQSRLDTASSDKDFASISASIYVLILQKGWRLILFMQMQQPYEELYATATDESRLAMAPVLEAFTEKIKTMEMRDIFTYEDIEFYRFSMNFQTSLAGVYVEDANRVLEAKKNQAHQQLDEQIRHLENNFGFLTEDFNTLTASLKTTYTSKINGALNVEELNPILAQMNSDFEFATQKLFLLSLLENFNNKNPNQSIYDEFHTRIMNAEEVGKLPSEEEMNNAYMNV